MMFAVASVSTVLVGFLLQSSLGSNAIDPKGNPVPEDPTTLPSATVGRSDLSGAPGNAPGASTTTLRSILFPVAAPPAAGNDTHCENNVNDNDNITVPIIPVSSTTGAPLSVSSTTTAITGAAPLASSTTTPAPASISSQPSSLAPVNNLPSSSPASGGVGVTEATTQAVSSTTAAASGIGNSATLGVSTTAATTQNSREGKNIDIHANSSSSASASVDLPRGYYLPPKNA